MEATPAFKVGDHCWYLGTRFEVHAVHVHATDIFVYDLFREIETGGELLMFIGGKQVGQTVPAPPIKVWREQVPERSMHLDLNGNEVFVVGGGFYSDLGEGKQLLPE